MTTALSSYTTSRDVTQQSENTRFAARERLPIAPVSLAGFSTHGIISEKHSGFKEDFDVTINDAGLVQYRIDRPKFQKMLHFVSHGYFKGVIILCWDRASRNKGDDTIIRKLMQKGVDFRFVYATYDNTSSGALHMDIDGMFAQHHSRVTSEKVTLATRHNREKGICTYRAPIGYLNEGRMDHKPFDPVRAPIIKRMFELYATGDWSLSDIARFANRQGFVTIPMRRRRTQEEMLDENHELDDIPQVSRPVDENHISRILSNPFYTGRLLTSTGNYIQSLSHKALIDDALFNDVRRLLKQRQTSLHYTEKLDQPLRGLVRCARCRRVYTPYTQKGIQYYNARCTKSCRNSLKNINFSFIATRIETMLAALYFTDDEIAQMDVRVGTDIALLEERRHRDLADLEREKQRIREALSYIRLNRLTLLTTGAYTPEALAEEERTLMRDLTDFQTKEQVSDIAIHDTMTDVVMLSELVKNVVPYYHFANPREKDAITRLIFSELTIADNTLQYKVKPALKCLEDRFAALHDPIAWLSELVDQRDGIALSIQELSALKGVGQQAA